jgi:hypothetical protein
MKVVQKMNLQEYMFLIGLVSKGQTTSLLLFTAGSEKTAGRG